MFSLLVLVCCWLNCLLLIRLFDIWIACFGWLFVGCLFIYYLVGVGVMVDCLI